MKPAKHENTKGPIEYSARTSIGKSACGHCKGGRYEPGTVKPNTEPKPCKTCGGTGFDESRDKKQIILVATTDLWMKDDALFRSARIALDELERKSAGETRVAPKVTDTSEFAATVAEAATRSESEAEREALALLGDIVDPIRDELDKIPGFPECVLRTVVGKPVNMLPWEHVETHADNSASVESAYHLTTALHIFRSDGNEQHLRDVVEHCRNLAQQ